jgi:pyruvate kinase
MTPDKKVKILATLGPAVDGIDDIRELVEAGVNIFRLNFSHGDHADHAKRYQWIREVERQLNYPLGILMDLQGPKLRVGKFAEGKVQLHRGQAFRLDLDATPGDERRVNLPHPEIIEALEAGMDLLLDDGKLRLRVVTKYTDAIDTTVLNGGELSDRKGVNVPQAVLELSPLTAKDRRDLSFGLELGVDWVALSFVQRPQDIIEARELIGDKAFLMAKIEKPSAVEQLREIAELSDAIMVARGDLGVEVPAESVPQIQKNIITTCRQLGKPLEAVLMMSKIIRQVENGPDYQTQLDVSRPKAEATVSDAISCAIRRIGNVLPVAVLVNYSESGTSSLRAARERPKAPILNLTPNLQTARRLTVAWGIHSVVNDRLRQVDEVCSTALEIAQAQGMAQRGDTLLITAGVPFGQPGSTNSLRIETLI